MKRLRDHQGAEDPTLARAAALVQAAQPAASNDAMRARVWQAVLEGRPSRARRVKAGVVVLLLGGGVALAHPRIGELVQSAFRWALEPKSGTAELPRPIRRIATAKPALAPAAPHVTAEAEPPTPMPPPKRRPAKPSSPHAAALLQDAVRALRNQADPAHAGALAEQYLERFPDGPLAEEAFSIAIEAARAQSNGRATVLTARYLERFPNGRFAAALRPEEPR
jgi:hypothetical protein